MTPRRQLAPLVGKVDTMSSLFSSRSLRTHLAGLLLAGACFAQEPKPTPPPEPAPAPAPAPAPTPAPAPAPAPVPTGEKPAQAPEAASAPVAAPPAEAKPVEAPKPAETAAVARLICYREKRFVGAGLHHTISVDGTEIGDLNNGTYFIVKIAPGEHKMHADEKKDEFTFTVEAGKTYYFKTEIKMGVWKGHGKISLVDATLGADEFTKWKAEDRLKYTPAGDLKKVDVLEMP